MSGRLTTHALDLVLGHGAGGLKVWVRRMPDQEFGEVELDDGGRAELVPAERFEVGLYEITFRARGDIRPRGR